MDKIPSPSAAQIIKLAFCCAVTESPYYVGIDRSNGNIDDKEKPKAIELK